MQKLRKIIFTITSIAIFSIAASQCFSQTQSNTASDAQNSTKKCLEMFYSIFDFVHRNYVEDVEAEKLYKGALKGMMESLGDPYSVYLETDSMRSMNETTKGTFGGIGVTISKPFKSEEDKPAYVEVQSPIEDTPGARSGIQSGDLIVKIEDKDTASITMENVLELLRGKPGTDVHLTIRRGKSMEFPLTITRALIEVPCAKWDMIGDVGYVRLIEYTPLTAQRLQDALDSFEKAGYKSLILDLRNNPGGLITAAVDVCDKFIDGGPIVSTKSRINYQNSMYTASPIKTTVAKNIPIIVLINDGSASASEITAGALKDNHLAYLVGTKTYGKGSVQQFFPLSQTDGIKVTMARYYTPSDTNIDKIGIPPDREVKFPKLEEEGEKNFTEIAKEKVIQKYVEEHKDMSESDIASYAKSLHKTYSGIDERTLRKLVRNEVNRLKPAITYDLDYDLQLQAALDILKNENFAELVKNTKTLKQLQDERLAKEEQEKKSESEKEKTDE